MSILSCKAKKTYSCIENYMSSYPEEKVYKTKMQEFLVTCPACFDRSCRVGHFTASAFLINTNCTHVLLMHHAKLDKWLQLGGHCDGNPDVAAVAVKEAQEESGIQEIRLMSSSIFDIDMHLIPSHNDEEAHYHFDIRFLLHAYAHDSYVQNHESKALSWVPLNTIRNNYEYSVQRMFYKIQESPQLLRK